MLFFAFDLVSPSIGTKFPKILAFTSLNVCRQGRVMSLGPSSRIYEASQAVQCKIYSGTRCQAVHELGHTMISRD
jgi:hypothetical protein